MNTSRFSSAMGRIRSIRPLLALRAGLVLLLLCESVARRRWAQRAGAMLMRAVVGLWNLSKPAIIGIGRLEARAALRRGDRNWAKVSLRSLRDLGLGRRR